jgi:hypothetical protein
MKMGKSTKTQRLREKVRAEVKHSKQTMLGNLPERQIEEPHKVVRSAQKKAD